MRAKIEETMGQAQKQLTLFEDGARRFLQGKWQQVQEAGPIQRLEAAMSSLKSSYSKTLKMDALKQRAEDLGSEYSTKAFHTVGLVTVKDLKALERKLSRLSTDINKLGAKPKKAKSNTKSNPAGRGTKKAAKSVKKNVS